MNARTTDAPRGGPPRVPVARRRRRRGVGMVELLVALSITASLLTATAVAVDAAFRAYHVNQEQALLTSKARVALAVLTTNVRGTTLHAPYGAAQRAQFAAGQTVTDSGLSLYDENDQPVSYRYDPATRRLLYVTATGSQTLARGVEAFSVTLEPMRSPASVRTGGGWDLLRRATFQITVKAADAAGPDEATGKQTLTMSASIAPRRNAW
ncbi:MAG TPA: hypothetical protein VF796_27490 [Humisphaera sp.]